MSLAARWLRRVWNANAFTATLLVAMPATSEEYVDRAAGFSATFPEKPFYDRLPVRPGKGTLHAYRVYGDRFAILAVAYQDYRPGTFAGRPMNKLCKEWADDAAAGTGKIRTIKEVRADRNLGCEAYIDFPKRDQYEIVIRTRYFLVKNRLYQITFMGDRTYSEAESVSTLFSSFRVLQ